MDNYTQQELYNKAKAFKVIVKINNLYCKDCKRCKNNNCFWYRVVMLIRDTYGI